MPMEEKRAEGIPPYRMNAIEKTVSEITVILVSGRHLYNPTYTECEIALELALEAVKKCKNAKRRKA